MSLVPYDSKQIVLKAPILSSHQVTPAMHLQDRCPTCGHPINYFRLLAGNNLTNPGYYSKFFTEIRKLGRGAGGSVFLCSHHLDSTILGEYAVKKIPVGDETWLSRMINEVRLLERVRCDNVVDYKHCWVEEAQLTRFGPPVMCLFILMEYCSGGNLEEYVLKGVTGFIPFDAVWSFFEDICKGLEHLHKHGIIHRDLKPSNLLLTPNATYPRVLISDFGECEIANEVRDRSGYTGTLEFSAPEVVEKKQVNEASDIWSLGMVLYFMLYNRLPYSQLDDINLLKQEILAGFRLEMIREDVPPEVDQLLLMLLSRDPEKRPSVSLVLREFTKEKFTTRILTRQLLVGPEPDQSIEKETTTKDNMNDEHVLVSFIILKIVLANFLINDSLKFALTAAAAFDILIKSNQIRFSVLLLYILLALKLC